jgi:LysM repeat protein
MGLNPAEYLLMQQIVGELGQPPTGGPYRLIQAPPTAPAALGSKTIAQSVGTVITVPVTPTENRTYTIAKGDTLTSLADKFKLSPEHMEQVLESQGII